MLNLEFTADTLLVITIGMVSGYIIMYYLQSRRMRGMHQIIKTLVLTINDQAETISELRNEKNNNR